jgi:hypothetical protein
MTTASTPNHKSDPSPSYETLIKELASAQKICRKLRDFYDKAAASEKVVNDQSLQEFNRVWRSVDATGKNTMLWGPALKADKDYQASRKALRTIQKKKVKADIACNEAGAKAVAIVEQLIALNDASFTFRWPANLVDG